MNSGLLNTLIPEKIMYYKKIHSKKVPGCEPVYYLNYYSHMDKAIDNQNKWIQVFLHNIYLKKRNMQQRMYNLLVFTGFRQPVMVLQVSLTATSTFLAWIDDIKTGQTHSATEWQSSRGNVLRTVRVSAPVYMN